ncbi:MAG: PKD domain-containing protein, partial [Prevotellaceae bacterium]|nr:PKD domain-containing protein [Prevotellaceae bacterium]
MKPSHRFLSFLLIGILLLACENEQQAWLSEMEGIPVCTVPAIIGKNQPVTITAGGITTPGNVAYTWSAPRFTPGTFTGTTLEALAPDEKGEYYILITAHSAGYRDVSKKYKITVVECIPMTGHLDIVAPDDVVKEETVQFTAMGIVSPIEGNVTYHWYAPDFSPKSYTGGATFETNAPKAAGTYEMIVVAKAENYCDTSIQKSIQVKPGRKMQGMFNINASGPTIIGQKVTFTASGITTPTAEYISYEWAAPKFTAGTASGNSYTTICPPTAGTYTVAVTARATGYTDSTVRKEIIVNNKSSMEGNITISFPSEVIVSKPVTFSITNHISNVPHEDISFVWDAPDFTPIQSTGNTFTATAPGVPGNYPIRVTASAAEYINSTFATTVTVKGGLDMTGTLDFHVPPQIVKDLEAKTFSVNSSLVAGGSSITYEWEAPSFSPTT